MYIVRNKQSEAILHINPAPLSQNLAPKEVYYNYDPETMEILTTNLSRLPEHYNVNTNNEIVALTLEEQLAAGVVTLSARQKVENGQIVIKTLEEQLADGLIGLSPTQKIENEQIVEKTLSEQLAEGLIELAPTQKIENGQIVEKTLSEQASEGLIELNEPFQYIENEQILSRTLEEVINGNLIINIDQYNIALDIFHRQMEIAIAKEYTVGMELKITKAYMAWMDEGRPSPDERETDFLTMQQDIAAIKEGFATIKDQLETLLSQLESNP